MVDIFSNPFSKLAGVALAFGEAEEKSRVQLLREGRDRNDS
jgi:hypothetical protein